MQSESLGSRCHVDVRGGLRLQTQTVTRATRLFVVTRAKRTSKKVLSDIGLLLEGSQS